MKKQRHTTLCASAAIAAALMLTPSAGFAQGIPASPQSNTVVVVPDISPAPPPPAASPPQVMTSNPVVQPVPVMQPVPPEPVAEETTEATPPPAATRTTARAMPAERSAPSAAPVAASPDPAPADTTSADSTSVEESQTGIAPGVIEPLPVAADQPTRVVEEQDGWLLPVLLGGFAVFALAIWGFIAIGRRKPVDRRAAAKIAASPAPAPRAPIATDPVAAAPVIAEPDAIEPQLAADPERQVQPLFAPRAAATGGLAHAGAAVSLPRELPASFEEREALFRRMVDARPDRANPFTDRKARMKRARLIMQSIGRDFGDARPWIDLSQYPQNWPELSRRTAAA